MADTAASPAVDSWAVAIHRSAADRLPVGAGFVVDSRHVLTCEHIMRDENDAPIDEVWISFPKAGVAQTDRRRARRLPSAATGTSLDVAMLRLVEPVPAAVKAARLRTLDGKTLHDHRWWAFGYPGQDPDGRAAGGRVGDDLGWGKIILETDAKYKVEPGFSGGPVWSADYDAVVGLILECNHDGSGKALMLQTVDKELPQLLIAKRTGWRAGDADDIALDAWGWSLVNDPEMGQHWLPKARGTLDDRESGRFRGRRAALQTVTGWLDRPKPDGRVLVVTGSPGVGKSAVLGRVITTADEDIRKQLPDDDDGVRTTVGSVHCAVHAKGKNALEIAIEIARGASVSLPATPADLVPALRRRLDFPRARFNLIVDALDEAVSPAQARMLIDQVLVPLAAQCGDVGVQVVVGSRRTDDDGELVGRFAGAAVIDLDSAEYFAESDLADYARVTLRQASAETRARAYIDEAVAAPIADRIAALSAQNFLVAGLMARSYGGREGTAVSPDRVSFTPTVGAALEKFVDHLGAVGRVPATLVLCVLAHAEAPGLPLSLWREGIAAFGGTVADNDLLAFAHGAAANFLVKTGADRGVPAFRLFHQALNDSLLPREGRADNEQKLVRVWVDYGRTTAWKDGTEYLRRSLPTHAVRAGQVDLLMQDDGYLLHADLRRLVPAAERAQSNLAKARAALLQRTPSAVDAGPAERSAMFSVVEKLDRLESVLPTTCDAPYRAMWAHTPPRLERTVMEGHAAAVSSVCPILSDGSLMLASGGEDGTVRVWDPTTGQLERLFQIHEDSVRSVCAVTVGSTPLLASAGQDGVVVLCDPKTGVFERVLKGHTDWVRAVCAVPAGERTWLASAGDDRTVRIWDPATGVCEQILTGSTGWVTAVCAIPDGNRAFVASADSAAEFGLGGEGVVEALEVAGSGGG